MGNDTPRPHCAYLDAGCVSYDDGLKLQASARRAVLDGRWNGVLLALEHQPVITVGRAGGFDNVKDRDGPFADAPVVATDRGGNVTCHGPGQLVVYPVLDLSAWNKDVVWYVRSLEEVTIRTLRRFGVVAGRKARYTGVWVGDRKIAAIGVSVRKWVTGHGTAINVSNDLDLFARIVPCGITEFGVTSLGRLGVAASLADVRGRFLDEFAGVFPCDFTPLADAGALEPEAPQS